MTDNNLPPWMYATNWHDLLMGLGGVIVECKITYKYNHVVTIYRLARGQLK